jgi:maleate isomerase
MTKQLADAFAPMPRPDFRIGVLVPPANPTVELEYPYLLPLGAAMHTMRLPVLPGDLDARNRGYVASYGPSLAGFGALRLDAISVAMTGPQYRLGYQGDLALCARLEDEARAPVETASLAIARALQTLGVEHLTLVSPYPDNITALACDYWRGAGFTMHSVTALSDQLVAYTVTPDQVLAAIRTIEIHPRGAVILSGTGMRTIEAIAAAADAIEQPLLASNPCALWSLGQRLQASPSPWLRRLMPAQLLPQ